MRRVGVGLLRVAAVALVAVVIGPAGIAMAAPTVTLDRPESPSNNATPSFTGTASEKTPVIVHIFNAGTRTEVSSAEATGTGGNWESGPASSALPEGQYEAEATQEPELGGLRGKSELVTFTVVTKPPTVTLNAPAERSNNTTPSFTGTATDTTEVTVRIYAGKTATGAVVSTAHAEGNGGGWASGSASPALPDGQYAALASQQSKFFGNGTGKSSTVTFTVVTKPPTVTLNAPAARSNNTTPSFTGTATDTTPVHVRIYNAATLVEVSSAQDPEVTGGAWSSGKAEPALPEGNYKAEATQPSSIFGNGEGRSAPAFFTVETAAPRVTLNPLPSPSNNTTPSFTGTASDTTTVTVQIYKGATTTGSVVSTATATPTGGSWTSANASPALKNGQYTATATQKSSLEGNAAGTSAPVTFVVDTNAPTVTLNSPPARSNNTTPSFKGTASDTTPVTVKIYAGSTATGAVVSTAMATGGGGWTSGSASPALINGQYTAAATQASSVGNHEGTSASVTFTVDTIPPHITLTSPANGSSTSSGSQSVQGSAGTELGDLQIVTVQLFSGSAIVGGQAPLQSIRVEASGGTWSATFGGLGPGTYTARAVQSDDVGNTGVSNTTTFVVAGAAGVAVHPPPAASFTWFPSAPYTGEPVSLASGSTDLASPITGFAWDLAGKGIFAAGGDVISTSFSTPGNHVVQLRVTDASGLSSVAAETIPVSGPPLTLMQPFPVVRIASTDTASGVKLSLLRVQAPAGARIVVGCKGPGCPVKSQSRVAVASKVAHRKGVAPVEFRRFERSLRAGVSLEIRISKRGQIGKYTRFVVRRGKLPVRVDTCLGPAGVKPLACPSS